MTGTPGVLLSDASTTTATTSTTPSVHIPSLTSPVTQEPSPSGYGSRVSAGSASSLTPPTQSQSNGGSRNQTQGLQGKCFDVNEVMREATQRVQELRRQHFASPFITEPITIPRDLARYHVNRTYCPLALNPGEVSSLF